MCQAKRMALIAGLIALLALPPVASLADGAPITDPYVWESLEEGQQIAVVALDEEGAAHTDLFASVVDHSETSHSFTFLVPLGFESRDVTVASMNGSTFDADHTQSLDRQMREDWLARRAYGDRVTDAVLPGELLLNGGVPAWLTALWGRSIYENRPRPEPLLEEPRVLEIESGRVAIYDLDESLDIDALIAKEDLPQSVRQTLQEARGQQLAVVTLITNPLAEAGGPQVPDLESRTLRLWDAASSHEIPVGLGAVDTVHALAFSPDRRWLAAVRLPFGAVQVYDTASWERVAGIAERWGVYGAIFSPDSGRMGLADHQGRVRVWRISDRTVQQTLEGNVPIRASLAFSARGTALSSVGRDGTVSTWDLTTGRTVTQGRAASRLGRAMARRYRWTSLAFWRDSLYWLTIAPIRGLAFLPFLLVGLIADGAYGTLAYGAMAYLGGIG